MISFVKSRKQYLEGKHYSPETTKINFHIYKEIGKQFILTTRKGKKKSLAVKDVLCEVQPRKGVKGGMRIFEDFRSKSQWRYQHTR